MKCKHRWVLEPACGPKSVGRCRVCGAEREFRNYLESEFKRKAERRYTRWENPSPYAIRHELRREFGVY